MCAVVTRRGIDLAYIFFNSPAATKHTAKMLSQKKSPGEKITATTCMQNNTPFL